MGLYTDACAAPWRRWRRASRPGGLAAMAVMTARALRDGWLYATMTAALFLKTPRTDGTSWTAQGTKACGGLSIWQALDGPGWDCAASMVAMSRDLMPSGYCRSYRAAEAIVVVAVGGL